MNVQRSLVAQLIAKLSPARVTLVAAESKSWFSATFAGERHELTLLVEGDAAARVAHGMQRTVACDEFDISGQLVADIIVRNMNKGADGVRLDIEALTVELERNMAPAHELGV
jgi:hypothetical protein